MIRHTKSDVRGSGQLMPEMRGRRIALYGVSHEEPRHLATEWQYGTPLKSYAYGKSKRSLRPAIPKSGDRSIPFLETPKSTPKKTKPLRKPPLPAKFNQTGPLLHYRPEPDPAEENLRRAKAKMRRSHRTVFHAPPKAKPARRSYYGTGPDPRLTGRDVDSMLAEFG